MKTSGMKPLLSKTIYCRVLTIRTQISESRKGNFSRSVIPCLDLFCSASILHFFPSWYRSHLTFFFSKAAYSFYLSLSHIHTFLIQGNNIEITLYTNKDRLVDSQSSDQIRLQRFVVNTSFFIPQSCFCHCTCEPSSMAFNCYGLVAKCIRNRWIEMLKSWWK